MSFPHTNLDSLIAAVKDGKADLVQTLLESNEGLLLSEDWIDYNLLVTALQRNHKNIVHLFLRLGCRVDKVPNNNNVTHTPLYYAVGLNDIEIVKKLLESKASIYNKKEGSETPLCLAMRNKQIEIVDLILSRYDFNKVDPTNADDIAHFLIACERNKPIVIKNFIKQGISVNSSMNLDYSQFPGYTPLHFAVKNLCLETVEFLLSQGANCNIKDANGWTALHLANQIRERIMLKQIDSSSPIETIIDTILFSQSLNLDQIEENDREISFFHIACTRDNTTIVDRFLQCGVNVNRCVPFESDTYSGFTGLHFAVYNNCIKVIDCLINFGADINAKTKEGLTPLNLAVLNGQTELVKTLLKRGANVNIENSQGETALHCAFYASQTKTDIIIDWLLHYATKNSNPTDSKGLSHFHIACTRKNIDVVESFLKNKVSIDAQVDKEDISYPSYAGIHFAVEYIQSEVLLLLLQYGANVNLKEGNGLTALHLACKQSYTKQQQIHKKLYAMNVKDIEQVQCKLVDEWDKWCRDQIKIVTYLIKYNADLNLRDSTFKATPLYYAFGFEFNKRGLSELTNFLHRCTEPDYCKLVVTTEKALFEMLSRTQKQMVELLLDHGADVDAKELTLGRTPLHNAVMSNPFCLYNRSEFCCLLKANCNVNARDFHGKTALHLAALNLNFPAVSELLEYGADINIETDSRETVLCAMKNSYCYNRESFELFNLHIKKMIALGSYISDKVKASYGKLCKRYENWGYNYFPSDEEIDSDDDFNFKFEEQEDVVFLKCKSELEILKTCHLNPYCSLYNILFKDADEMAVYIKNDSFTSILNSPDFNRNYPLYGYLLQLQYRRGTVRSFLLKPAKKSLNKIAMVELPDSCSEQILKYLNNDNLHDLIKSTEVIATKRKLRIDSLDDDFGPSLVKQLRLGQ